MDGKPADTPEVQSMSDAQLLRLRAALHIEMHRRKLAFSVGDIGEEAVIEFFRKTAGLPNLQRAPAGTKNVDALSRRGDRFSIKTIWRGSKTGTIYPDVEDRQRPLFEYLVVVQLSENLDLKRIVQLSWQQFCDVRCWDKRMNAWYVPLTTRAMSAGVKIYHENTGAK
jgi:hypothetical protein